MKKFILIISVFLICCVSSWGQMTDNQVIDHVKQQSAAGVSQQRIAQDLMRRGVTKEQLMRIRSLQVNKELNDSKKAKKEDDEDPDGHIRSNNGEREPDDNDFTSLNGETSKIKKMRIFGHDVFRSKALTFESSMNIPTPSTYTLGAGDEVVLDIYGSSQSSNSYKITPDGSINIHNIGPVNIAGMTVPQAQAKIYKSIGQHYQGSNIKLTVGQTRSITVNILGEVEVPGTYTVSAFSTIFNCLYLAGGITDLGTMRNVKISRNGRVISVIDIYDYLLNGKMAGSIMLQDNDVIIVGPYENIVAITGSIKRPMYYEMKNNESLQSLVTFAGGFKGGAHKEQLRVMRIGSEGISVHNIDEWDFSTFTMNDADSVIVDDVIGRYKNTVTITGGVFRPGSFNLGNAVKSVKDLVNQAGGLREQAFLGRAVLKRLQEDRTLRSMSIDIKGIMDGTSPDIVLQNEDQVIIGNNETLYAERYVTISGDIYQPGRYEFSDNETVEDLIIQAGGLRETAALVNVEIARRYIPEEENVNYEQLSKIISITINNGTISGEDSGIKLMPFDVITIHSRPGFTQQVSVNIGGEVKYSGTYILSNKEERISSIITRAGGLTSKAHVKGTTLIRKATLEEMERQRQLIEMSMSKSDSTDLTKLDLSDTYSVGIDLEAALKNPGSDADIILRDSDIINIPLLDNTVKINGEVLYPNTVSYVKGKSYKYYLNQAGGASKTGVKNNTYIIYANGQVSRAKKGKIEPGCEIVVPTKKTKEADYNSISQWVGISSSLATVAAVITAIVK